MTNRKTMLLALGLGATAFLLLSGCHRGGWHAGDHSPERAHQMLDRKVNEALDGLHATEAQRAEVNAVKEELFQEGMKLRAGHQATRDVLLEQWSSATPDAARLHGLVDERAEAMRAFAHRVVDGILRVHARLTPEQRAQVAEHVRERMGAHP